MVALGQRIIKTLGEHPKGQYQSYSITSSPRHYRVITYDTLLVLQKKSPHQTTTLVRAFIYRYFYNTAKLSVSSDAKVTAASLIPCRVIVTSGLVNSSPPPSLSIFKVTSVPSFVNSM